jgi:hypothetical protein
MLDVSFDNLLVVSVIAALAPLAVGFLPRLRIPSPVLEIVAGIIVGPAVLGWVEIDLPVQILALIGLAFLLFLAGLEIEARRLSGAVLRLAVVGYLVTLAGVGVREIARRLGRAPSTISRELRRNAATRGGKLDYRASVAQWKAELLARRPKTAKLVTSDRLREYVQERLSGQVWHRHAAAGAGSGTVEGAKQAPAPGQAMGERVEPGADLSPAED